MLTSNTKPPREGKVEFCFLRKHRDFLIMWVLLAQHFTNDWTNWVKESARQTVRQKGDIDDQADVIIQTCHLAVKCGHAHAHEETWGGGQRDRGWVDVQLQPGTWLPEWSRCPLPSPDQPGEQHEKKDVSVLSGQISSSPTGWSRGFSRCTTQGFPQERVCDAPWWREVHGRGTSVLLQLLCRPTVGAFQMCEGWLCFAHRPLCVCLAGE